MCLTPGSVFGLCRDFRSSVLVTPLAHEHLENKDSATLDYFVVLLPRLVTMTRRPSRYLEELHHLYHQLSILRFFLQSPKNNAFKNLRGSTRNPRTPRR